MTESSDGFWSGPRSRPNVLVNDCQRRELGISWVRPNRQVPAGTLSTPAFLTSNLKQCLSPCDHCLIQNPADRATCSAGDTAQPVAAFSLGLCDDLLPLYRLQHSLPLSHSIKSSSKPLWKYSRNGRKGKKVLILYVHFFRKQRYKKWGVSGTVLIYVNRKKQGHDVLLKWLESIWFCFKGKLSKIILYLGQSKSELKVR